MFSFEGKKALVTGGGRGIGRAIALAFAKQGADVAIAARGRSELEQVAEEIRSLGRQAFVHAVDLAKTEESVRMVNAAAADLGSLDILVNNAGGITDVPGSAGPLDKATIEAFDAMYALNVRTPLFASVAACRLMARQGKGGAILNMVSIDAVFPAPTEGIYGSAKAAVVNLTKVLAYEAGKDRIRVNAIAPGPVWTPLNPADKKGKKVEQFGADTPMGRPAQPEEIAPAFVFLAAPSCSSYITGEILPIIGGYSAG
jgi:NAD(P)-dependent dehydrogenase (short-subunit alcohol dehydrogenase family)